MLGIAAADDPDHALALDHLAMLADRLDTTTYFHELLRILGQPLKIVRSCQRRNRLIHGAGRVIRRGDRSTQYHI